MESDQGNADCPPELFGPPIGAAPDRAQSHLAMGGAHAGLAHRYARFVGPRPPTHNLGNGIPGFPTVYYYICFVTRAR